MAVMKFTIAIFINYIQWRGPAKWTLKKGIRQRSKYVILFEVLAV
jgi:hypothetical protein